MNVCTILVNKMYDNIFFYYYIKTKYIVTLRNTKIPISNFINKLL